MKVQIDKTYPLPCSAEIAWEFLQNIEAVAACMPGAKITERIDAGAVQGNRHDQSGSRDDVLPGRSAR